MGINDFPNISDWDVDLHNDPHKRDLCWLNSQVKDLGQSNVRVMVFTHWSPSMDKRSMEPARARHPITTAISTN